MPNFKARRLRNNPTTPETAAWKLLRRLRAEGIHVRRQHPIGRYVADFAIMKARLAIELDGAIHALHAERDEQRDKAFNQIGWRVLRLPNKAAFAPDYLLDAVRSAVMNEPPKLKFPEEWIAAHDEAIGETRSDSSEG
jgi:very-short-patch-repair endonuclease